MANFHRNTQILQLPEQHVSVLHGRATAGHVAGRDPRSGMERARDPGRGSAGVPPDRAAGVNVYLSQARFRGWRRTQLLSSVNALWLDIDHYKAGHRWSDAQGALRPAAGLRTRAIRRCRCRPTCSPLVAVLAPCGSWKVLPREALPRWQALEVAFGESIAGLGVDRAARDVTRVLRLAGTIHTGTQRLVRCLYPDVGTPRRHAFDELCRVLLPYARPERFRAARAASKGKARSAEPVVHAPQCCASGASGRTGISAVGRSAGRSGHSSRATVVRCAATWSARRVDAHRGRRRCRG